MSKPRKSREKSSTKEKSATTGRKWLVPAIGIIVIVAIIAVIAYILLVPGTGGSPAITGTGTGAAAVIGDSISVYYTGTFTNGTVFDSNVNSTRLRLPWDPTRSYRALRMQSSA